MRDVLRGIVGLIIGVGNDYGFGTFIAPVDRELDDVLALKVLRADGGGIRTGGDGGARPGEFDDSIHRRARPAAGHVGEIHLWNRPDERGRGCAALVEGRIEYAGGIVARRLTAAEGDDAAIGQWRDE